MMFQMKKSLMKDLVKMYWMGRVMNFLMGKMKRMVNFLMEKVKKMENFLRGRKKKRVKNFLMGKEKKRMESSQKEMKKVKD